MNNKLKSTLGLSMRAGKIVSGEDQVLKAIRAGKVSLVVIAQDASDNAKKQYRDKCSYYRVAWVEVMKMNELGEAIGKSERAAVAITDLGLAKLFEKGLNKPVEVEGIEQTRTE